MQNGNLIINKKRPSSNIDILKIKDKKPPATGLNIKHFCNVASELESKLSKAERRFSSYMKRNKGTFHFIKLNEMEVFLILDSIDTEKSFGFDKVHPLLLTSAALVIFRPLKYIRNLTLKQSIFPDS